MGPALAILLAGMLNGTGTPATIHEDGPATRRAAPHAAMLALNFGEGARSYWLFEPAEPRPDEPAPVVVLLHGWMSTNPGLYGAWIAHLARRGHIVIYPRYQDDWTTRPAEFLPNSLDAIRNAVAVLETAPGRVRPDRDRFALIGHSAGGNLAVQLAAMADEVGLPAPKAVVAALPGEVLPASGPELADIPASTALVVAAAQEDVVVGDDRAREIFEGARSIPRKNKQFLFLRSDRTVDPPLIADHAAPMAALPWLDTGEGPLHAFQMNGASVDHFDREVFWKAADLALLAGFSGRSLDELTDSGSRFQHLGHRDDGLPIRPPLVSDDLASIPRVTLANGVRLVRWPSSVFDPFSRPDLKLGEAARKEIPRRISFASEDESGPIDEGVTRAASRPTPGTIR
ncbi:alpha/beta hydrolase [Tautonia plasticadhaerens]|uniref:Alpha/beta hydrolase family protein n=1 Tax=Tautonia plasticadhaerens TaxID=2527974 RepID=A0A518GYQ5_9BACT|nr:alpha/beta hydrolase [Tautonia plasticadhaerens]QDV33683.1 Alpha/beta hydrolase family protein [Tautonia plasticadhaerens]